MNKYFLTLLGAFVISLSACASVDRSTASEDDVKHYKPTALDRQTQF